MSRFSLSVCDICLISTSQICGLAGGGGRGGLRLGHPPGHERDCNRPAQSRLSWLCKTILPFTSQASQSSTAINQTRSLPSSDLWIVHHRSDRSETSVLVRLPNLYSPGSLPRDWSAERSEADRGLNNFFSSYLIYTCSILDEFPRDGCHMCGMPRAEMAQHGHGEGVCNQRPIACPLCAKTFTLWSHYETHKKCHQKLKQRQYPCQSCGKVVKFIALSAMLQICEILCSLYVVLRSSRPQATGTCTKGSTREFARSSAFLVGSFSARRLICRSTSGRRDTSKPPSSTKSGRRRA